MLIDANLLVYAYVRDFAQHDAARDWLEDQLGSTPRVGLPWSSLLAFVRLTTNPRVFAAPQSMADAWDQVGSWLDADPVWVPEPTRRHRDVLGQCLSAPGIRSADVPDAHLAALAIEHGLTLASSDSGFSRYDGLTWANPLR